MDLQNTYTANTILSAGPDAQKTDHVCKAVLKSRWVLANILKGVIPEYADTPVHEIAETYIEPDQIELYLPVNGFPEQIQGLDKEDTAYLQTTVYYDVRLRALLPNRTKTQVYLYIDVEAQNSARESRLGYPLEKRAIYYMSRMISNQLQTVSRDTNYNVIQKVYSIWICMGDDIPKNMQQSITGFTIAKKDIYRKIDIPKKNYDLMSAVFIRLGHGETEEHLLGMLQTIFTDNAPPEERLKKLETEYGIPRTKEFNEEVSKMCTYSQFMLDRGEKEGLEKGLKTGLETGKYKTYYDLISDGTLTLKQAAEKCSLSPDEFQKKLIELKIIEG